MIPLYLAEMNDLPLADSAIYEEFQQGNRVVNKKKKKSLLHFAVLEVTMP